MDIWPTAHLVLGQCDQTSNNRNILRFIAEYDNTWVKLMMLIGNWKFAYRISIQCDVWTQSSKLLDISVHGHLPLSNMQCVPSLEDRNILRHININDDWTSGATEGDFWPPSIIVITTNLRLVKNYYTWWSQSMRPIAPWMHRCADQKERTLRGMKATMKGSDRKRGTSRNNDDSGTCRGAFQAPLIHVH